MPYQRVLPRDLFNEANLLKCVGKLALLVEDGLIPGIECRFNGGRFQVEQDDSDGSTYVANVQFIVKKTNTLLEFKRPLNSREPWPLELVTEEHTERVFDETGNLILFVAYPE